MKVRFEMRLYLPFLLPRSSAEWGSEAAWSVQADLAAAVVVLPQDSVKDAPKSIDGFDVRREMERGSTKTAWQIIAMPHKHFYEAIAIGVFGELSDEASVHEPSVQARYRNAAIRAARTFLEFCRAFAADTEIFFDSPEVSAESPRFVGFPHYEGWYDEERGSQIGDGSVNFGAGEDIVGRHGVTGLPWEVLKGALASAREAPTELLLLLDAETALARRDDRKSVLFAAIAVEVAIKGFLSNRKASWKLPRGRKMGFAEKYFDLLLRSNGLPSLKDAAPQVFLQVRSLFRVRNNIAHKGICYENLDSDGKPDRLSRVRTAQLIEAARKAVAWVDARQIP